MDPAYRRFFDSIPAFVAVSAADGRLVYRNKAWAEFTGIEDPFQSVWSIVHPEDGATVRDAWEHARRSGNSTFEAQYRVRGRRDGDYHWIRTITSAVLDAQGAVDHYVGVGFPNDDYQRLLQTQAQFRALFDSNLIGMLTASARGGYILSANDEFLRMVGYTRNDLRSGGIDWRAMTPPQWKAADDRAVNELFTYGVAAPFEKEYRRKDGSLVPVLIGAVMIDTPKDVVICYVLDLSETHQARARERRAAERLEILAECGRAVASSLRLDDVLERIVSALVPRIADLAVLNVLQPNGEYEVAAARHADPVKEPLARGLIGRSYVVADADGGTSAVVQGAAPIHHRTVNDEHIRRSVKPSYQAVIRALAPRSSVAVPLIVGGAVFGALSLNYSDSGRVYEADDVEFLSDVGLRVAQGIENARRYESERELRERISRSERELRALAETIPVIVWTADATGSVDWFNRNYYDYTGQTPDIAIGWGWQSVHHPEDLTRMMEEWPRAVRTGQPIETETRLRRYDGVYHTFLVRAEPVRDANGVVKRWYGSNVDIQAEREALQRSRHIAATVQKAFLPAELPQLRNLRVDAVYHAADSDATVGGDWYDAVETADGRLLFSIGDVAGHGVDASLISGRLRFAIRDYTMSGRSTNEILTLLNRVLLFEHPGSFATAIVALYNPRTGLMRYSSAGHPPPLLVHDGSLITLGHGGIPLGVERDFATGVHDVVVRSGDLFALYTDGLTEFGRYAAAGEPALHQAVLDCARDASLQSPAAFVRDRVLAGVESRDDAALLLVHFVTTVRSGTRRHTGLTKQWRFHSSDAYAAHLSRHELMNFVRRYARDGAETFASELIIGEILANTVEHAPGLVEIEIDWTDEKPRVRVRDSGPGLDWKHATNADPSSESGRGLFLVESLAEAVTVTKAPGAGTDLRVTLPVTRDRT